MTAKWRERIKRDGQHVTSSHASDRNWATHGIATRGYFDIIAIDAMGIDTGNGYAITTCDSQSDGVSADGAEIVAGSKVVVH